MEDREAVEMMRRCSGEIKQLRAEIERLRPKAEAYDNMAAMIGLLPKPSRTMGEDLAYTLDQRVSKIIDGLSKGVAVTA